jgi:hypothetical protein
MRLILVLTIDQRVLGDEDMSPVQCISIIHARSCGPALSLSCCAARCPVVLSPINQSNGTQSSMNSLRAFHNIEFVR